jgi:hypothetical protein
MYLCFRLSFFRAVAHLDISLWIAAVGDTALKWEKRIKIGKEKRKISTRTCCGIITN